MGPQAASLFHLGGERDVVVQKLAILEPVRKYKCLRFFKILTCITMAVICSDFPNPRCSLFEDLCIFWQSSRGSGSFILIKVDLQKNSFSDIVAKHLLKSTQGQRNTEFSLLGNSFSLVKVRNPGPKFSCP